MIISYIVVCLIIIVLSYDIKLIIVIDTAAQGYFFWHYVHVYHIMIVYYYLYLRVGYGVCL
jgi:hypothetical protein